MGLPEIREKARRALHDRMAVPAVYAVPGASLGVECSVRVLRASTLTGIPEGAKRWSDTPQIVFLVEQISPIRGARVTLGTGEVFRVDNVLPVYGITVTAEVLQL